jgi:catechol 2,3-dioxygenase-like lactoylglutathione lyase family enzyme
MIRQLAHLNFVTDDLSKIIDFYVNKLGLRVKFTLDNKDGKPFGYFLNAAILVSSSSSIRGWPPKYGAAK